MGRGPDTEHQQDQKRPQYPALPIPAIYWHYFSHIFMMISVFENFFKVM